MKSKKVTMLAAALVVAVVAAAGIGYAVNYTATTTNTNNNASVAYVTVNQNSTGAYGADWLTKLYFNTTNDSTGHSYYLIKDWKITGKTVEKTDEASNATIISKDLGLTVNFTNSKDTKIDIKVTTTGLTNRLVGPEYKLVLAKTITNTSDDAKDVTAITDVIDVATTAADKAEWIFSNVPVTSDEVSGGVTYHLVMFIEGDLTTATTAPSSTAGFAANTEFTIVVTADDA